MEITILGCGSSPGIPAIGNYWGACDPYNPKNRRTRSSIFVSHDNSNVLVDTSPDLRQQLLDNDISKVDALIYTHSHADHLNGIDDIRGINRAMDNYINMYLPPQVLEHIKQRFPYVLSELEDNPHNRIYKPWVKYHVLDTCEIFKVGSILVKTIAMYHDRSCKMITYGYRFNDIAYTTDFTKFFDDNIAKNLLSNLDLWIIGVVGDKKLHTHMHYDGAIELIERFKPKRTILTHLGAGCDYEVWSNKVPENVFCAYDGMKIQV